jgi:hypothetical protein
MSKGVLVYAAVVLTLAMWCIFLYVALLDMLY